MDLSNEAFSWSFALISLPLTLEFGFASQNEEVIQHGKNKQYLNLQRISPSSPLNSFVDKMKIHYDPFDFEVI